ncbi:MAG TPA: type II toxin-antitoxin system prevent-host-death family antitoxin [Acidobacteriota bacterium]|jgi:prevent-host-death family protein
MYNIGDFSTLEAYYMKTVTFTEFRRNASEVLDLVEEGETVRILRHGRAIAKIVPADPREAKPAWKRRGLRLIAAGASLSKAVLEERRSPR